MPINLCETKGTPDLEKGVKLEWKAPLEVREKADVFYKHGKNDMHVFRVGKSDGHICLYIYEEGSDCRKEAKREGATPHSGIWQKAEYREKTQH